MTTAPIDLYAALGLARDATQSQISAAYRRLLRRYHPDTRTAADASSDAVSDAALQHVLVAYAVLRDPARRAEYDKRTSPRSSPTPTPRPTAQPTSPIGLSWVRPFDDPPVRAGPVHWTPSAPAKSRGAGR